MSTSGLPRSWGDVDGTAPPPTPTGYDGVHLVRAVRVAASTAVVFLWLTQLKVAPYSYDLLDNGGRRSPRRLTPNLTLAAGDRVMEIFTATRIDRGRLLELTLTERRALQLFGPLVCTYQCLPDPHDVDATVLRCDLHLAPSTGLGAVRSTLLAWGDLIMMRRQLLNLKALSEETATTTALR